VLFWRKTMTEMTLENRIGFLQKEAWHFVKKNPDIVFFLPEKIQ
jgi:hypothetical protein